MGFFSRIFGGKSSGGKGTIHSGRNSSWVAANRFNKARGGHAGGYGAITFGNIMNAHCSEEDIIDEFQLDAEECSFRHPQFGTNCWTQAYREEYARAATEAAIMSAMGIPTDPEDLIDWDTVEETAYEYAEELADLYIHGMTWIPEEIINWGYYEISSHNN